MLFVRYYLWIAPHILLGVFLVIFFVKGLQGQLPSVATYASVNLALFLLGVICRLRSPFPTDAYRWIVLVLGGGLLTAADLWVIYELLNKLVLSRSSLARMGRLLLSGTLAVLLLGAAAAVGTVSKIGVDQALNIFEAVDLSSSLIIVGLLLVLFIFSHVLRISWRNWVVGIALGFGISACADLSTAAWRSALGRPAFIPVDIVQMGAFHLCVIIWLTYLLLPESPKFTGSGLQRDDLDAWNEQVQKIVH
jgi:hypothetical protein